MDAKLIKKIGKAKPGGKAIRTWARASTITPEMVGFIFDVHNGKNFITVTVTEEMVGHKLGEFSHTRKFVRHGGRMAKEQELATLEAERQKIAAAQESKEGEKK